MIFLSEDNLQNHRRFAEKLRLKYSILEKSICGLKGLKLHEIMRQNMKKEDKRDSVLLLGEIMAHELFFSSFSDTAYPSCELICHKFGSLGAFYNCFYKEALENRYGYTALCRVRGDVRIYSRSFGYELFTLGEPMLLIDVCEHTYFEDYGFDKEGFLQRCIPYLNLKIVDNFMK